MTSFEMTVEIERNDETRWYTMSVEVWCSNSLARVNISCGNTNSDVAINGQGVDLDAKQLRALAASLNLSADWIESSTRQADREVTA
jgi:hypothetical protein